MRIYRNFKEAHGEIIRDIVEMGIRVYPKTYQNKHIEGKTEFETLELQNYMYTVTEPDTHDLTPTQPWASAEFRERVKASNTVINPGEAWKLRPDVWSQFINSEGCFDYTYNERYNQYDGLNQTISLLKKDPGTRQAYLSVWNPKDVMGGGGKLRIPCSLGYLFQIRQDKLNMVYIMRSCDFVTHFQNDVYLSFRLQQFISNKVGVPVGSFTQFIASLHIYQKDADGVF